MHIHRSAPIELAGFWLGMGTALGIPGVGGMGT
jgi:hypothetical protein